MNKYKITCLTCNATRFVALIRTNHGSSIIDWLDNSPDEKIVSGRKRLDSAWGWQCLCGNDDLLTEQEQKHISNKQKPDPKEVADLAKRLVPQKPKFRMEKE